MRGCGIAIRWCVRRQEESVSDLGKLIFGLLRIPFVNLSQLFFQISFFLGERIYLLSARRESVVENPDLFADLDKCQVHLRLVRDGLNSYEKLFRSGKRGESGGKFSNHNFSANVRALAPATGDATSQQG